MDDSRTRELLSDLNMKETKSKPCVQEKFAQMEYPHRAGETKQEKQYSTEILQKTTTEVKKILCQEIQRF